MLKCQVCKMLSESGTATCPACGEASWAESPNHPESPDSSASPKPPKKPASRGKGKRRRKPNRAKKGERLVPRDVDGDDK